MSIKEIESSKDVKDTKQIIKFLAFCMCSYFSVGYLLFREVGGAPSLMFMVAICVLGYEIFLEAKTTNEP